MSRCPNERIGVDAWTQASGEGIDVYFAVRLVRGARRHQQPLEESAAMIEFHKTSANKPAACNAGIASRLTIGHHWPGLPEQY